MKTITTHASAATVYRWATQGSKRLRAKYRHAETVCLVINRREAPIMGLDPDGNYGVVGNLKMEWGYGHVRECGPEDTYGRSMRFPAKGPPWDNTESMAVYLFPYFTTTGFLNPPIEWADKTPSEIIADVLGLINSIPEVELI